MDVGNFLKLQRAFHGQREHRPAPQIEHVAGLGDLAGDLADAVIVVQNLRHQGGDADQRLTQPRFVIRADRATLPTRPDRQRRQHRQLGGEGLGRRHPDFGSGEGLEHGVCLAGDRGLGDVDQRQHRVAFPRA